MTYDEAFGQTAGTFFSQPLIIAGCLLLVGLVASLIVKLIAPK